MLLFIHCFICCTLQGNYQNKQNKTWTKKKKASDASWLHCSLENKEKRNTGTLGHQKEVQKD